MSLDGEIEDGGIVRAECTRGHRATYVLTEPLFDLMFEFACLALIGGYRREAVVGFVTALERFEEFCVRAVAHRLDVDPDAYVAAARGDMKHAERQHGAFLFSYLVALKRPFDTRPRQRVITLRNSVAHGGVIPSYEEAHESGETVMRIVHGVLLELFPGAATNLEAASPLIRLLNRLEAEQRRRLQPGECARSWGRATVLSSRFPQLWCGNSFDQGLEMLTVGRGFLHVVDLEGSGGA